MPRATPECLRLCWTDPATGEARSVSLEGALRLGSNRQHNDIVLPIRSVEPCHAEILGNLEGGWELVALGPRRLRVGETMTARASLSAGTEFAVGPVAFRVRPADAAPRRPVSSTGSRRAFVPPPPRPPRATPARRRSPRSNRRWRRDRSPSRSRPTRRGANPPAPSPSSSASPAPPSLRSSFGPRAPRASRRASSHRTPRTTSRSWSRLSRRRLPSRRSTTTRP